MSRTDRTKPLWVRYAEHDPRPVHDHRYGACDLPPDPAQTAEAPDTRCRWEHPGTLLFGRTCCSGCSVRGCVRERQQMARQSNRKERYAGRREARRFVVGEVSD
ncbi:hypothetical protein [Streptomyces sp. NPDC048516]|uniref:hypothetical protein n=1 Tax=Streptomyces sp. NPDC048516 TaxID=3365565 RepID=UPI00372277E3